MKFAMVRVVGVLIDSYRQFMHSFNLQQDYFQVRNIYFDTFFDVLVKAIKRHLSSSLTH